MHNYKYYIYEVKASKYGTGIQLNEKYYNTLCLYPDNRIHRHLDYVRHSSDYVHHLDLHLISVLYNMHTGGRNFELYKRTNKRNYTYYRVFDCYRYDILIETSCNFDEYYYIGNEIYNFYCELFASILDKFKTIKSVS